MVNKLKDLLAKNEFLRKKDFDIIMAGIRDQQKIIEKEISLKVDNRKKMIMKEFFNSISSKKCEFDKHCDFLPILNAHLYHKNQLTALDSHESWVQYIWDYIQGEKA